MPTALIVFASFTGNTEELAHCLKNALSDLGVKVEMTECTQVNPEEFLKYDICVVATYTYGSNANLPEEIEDFYFGMENTDLTGKIYGSLGTGEELYDKFCQSVIDFDQQFQKVHATKGAEMLMVEEAPQDEDMPKIRKFASDLLATYHSLATTT